jgi:hypothetical protein
MGYESEKRDASTIGRSERERERERERGKEKEC